MPSKPRAFQDKGDKFGNIVQAKQEMGMTKEQQDDAKKVRSPIRQTLEYQDSKTTIGCFQRLYCILNFPLVLCNMVT